MTNIYSTIGFYEMSIAEIPLDVDSFLLKHGKEECVTVFSRDAVKSILKRIEKYRNETANHTMHWQDFFTSTQELWSEGVILLPREDLDLSSDIIDQLDRIKKLRVSKERCSELIYNAALAIAKRNGFEQLPRARFLI